MPVIDSHQHVWDLEHVAYPWLTSDLGVLNRTHEMDELEPDLIACGVDASILVQAANSVEDTRWMQRVADDHLRVAGIVAWVPLDKPAEAARLLDAYATDPRIVGIRHLLHTEQDVDWLLRTEVHDGLALLAERHLVFDVVGAFDNHLRHVPAIAAAHPSLTIVVDHLGSPPINVPAARKSWEQWMFRAAEHPHVAAKVSGLSVAGATESNAAALQPWVDYALSVFRADRLMFGGDWPVSRLAGDYLRAWSTVNLMIAGQTDAERACILGDTASRIYGLLVSTHPTAV